MQRTVVKKRVVVVKPAPVVKKRVVGVAKMHVVKKRVVAAPNPVKKRVVAAPPPVASDDDDDDDDDDASISDSMVGIRRERAEQARVEASRRVDASAPSDQVSRLVAAHEQAAEAVDRALADDASESTVQRVAKRARDSTLGASESAASSKKSVAAAAAAAVAPSPAKLAPPADGQVMLAHAAADGRMPAMDMSANYEAFRRAISEEASSSSSAAVSGQLGQRVAVSASDLVRRIRTAADDPSGVGLPRLVASMASPLDSTFMRRVVTDTVRSAEVPPHLNYASALVDKMRQSLEPSRRAHEEQMFRQPLDGEPECSRGRGCRGLLIMCRGGGATLIAYYAEAVWQRYMTDRRRGLLEARLPQNSGLCLLCIRYDVESFLVSMRNENVQMAVAASPGGPPPTLIQSHFNLTDVEGEYRLEDCNTPVGSIYEGLLYPVVKPSLRSFVRTTDPDTGAVVFRQTLAYPTMAGAKASMAPPATRPHRHF